jgi:hypothetical protein
VIADRLPAGALIASKGFRIPARIFSFIGNTFLVIADGIARCDEPNMCPLPQKFKSLDCIL